VNLKLSLAVLLIIVALAVGIVSRKRPAGAEGEAEAEARPGETNGIVAFRMEQQWLIHLKLALVEEAQMPSKSIPRDALCRSRRAAPSLLRLSLALSRAAHSRALVNTSREVKCWRR